MILNVVFSQETHRVRESPVETLEYPAGDRNRKIRFHSSSCIQAAAQLSLSPLLWEPIHRIPGEGRRRKNQVLGEL